MTIPTNNSAGIDNRAALLQVALTLFATRGYDAIGVQEIAATAGVTKPTLYHYFGNKRGVLATLVQERFAPLLADLAATTRYQGDLPLTMERVVAVFFQFAQREPLLYRMQLAMWFALPANEAHQVIAGVTAQQGQQLEELFRAAAADHGNMRDRHRAYAATFLGMINTYVSMALNGYGELDAATVRQAVRQFSYGIYS